MKWLYILYSLYVCVREGVCVCDSVCERERETMDRSYMEAITGSEDAQTPTVPLSLGQVEFISLLRLSLSLNYLRMSPNKGARWNAS